MPDALSAVLLTPGFTWLCLTIGAAGFIRGFAGFGTAMVFVPVASQYLPMADIILLISLSGLGSMAAMVPAAIRQADRGEVAVLAVAAALTIPIGIWIMGQVDVLVLRWIAVVIIGATLAAIMSGWRFVGQLGWVGRIAIGSVAGLVGGLTGLTGPVVIVFYLANARDVTKVRANTIPFLAAIDVVILVNLFVATSISRQTLWLSLALGLPYLATTLIGKAAFNPRFEKLYRTVAYSVIGVAVITSIPVLD